MLATIFAQFEQAVMPRLDAFRQCRLQLAGAQGHEAVEVSIGSGP